MDGVSFKKTLVRFEIKETVLVLAASVVLPFMVHLLPAFGGIPLGARLIPMFYAPFIAVILFRPHVAIITGLFAPILNSLLTAHPVPEKVAMLIMELLIFSVVAFLIQRRWKRFLGTAIFAYLVAVLSVGCLLGSIGFFLSTIINSFPGLVVLFLINIFLLRLQPEFTNDRDKFSGNL